MAKKSTTKKKTSKTSRLGHDPLQNLNIESDEGEDKNDHAMDIEADEQIMKAEPDSEKGILHLPSHFSIAAVEEVYGQMSSLMKMKKTSIEVESTEVESIDTAALQLLYAFAEQSRMSGTDIHWHPRSKKIDEASSILNINILTENES